MIVVIPAYEPDEKLLRLVDELKQQTDYKIIIVDDGSKNAESKMCFQSLKRIPLLLCCTIKSTAAKAAQ